MVSTNREITSSPCQPVFEHFGNDPELAKELMGYPSAAPVIDNAALTLEREAAATFGIPENALNSGSAARRAQLTCGRCALRGVCMVRERLALLETKRRGTYRPHESQAPRESQLIRSIHSKNTSTEITSAKIPTTSVTDKLGPGIMLNQRTTATTLDAVSIPGGRQLVTIIDASPIIQHDGLTQATAKELEMLYNKLVELATASNEAGTSQLFNTNSRSIKKLVLQNAKTINIYEIRVGGKARLYFTTSPPSESNQHLIVTILGSHGDNPASQKSFLSKLTGNYDNPSY